MENQLELRLQRQGDVSSVLCFEIGYRGVPRPSCRKKK
jgi:hypothetical protein